MSREQKLARLGYLLTPVVVDGGRLLQATRSGNLVYTAGQLPELDGISMRGKVGAELTIEDAREAARLCTVNCLRAISSLVGSLDSVTRIVRIFGMVNVAPGFDETLAVIDACSDLLIDVFGEAGKHVRCAIGMTVPLNYAVEIEMTAELNGVSRTSFWEMPQ